MFGGLKNLAGLAGMMKDMPRIREKMMEVRRELADTTVTAETGGGAVRVTASCTMKVVNIEIDPALLSGLVDIDNADDREMAQDLITGAVNAALEKAKDTAEKRLGEAASELGLPLPPGGLGGMMG